MDRGARARGRAPVVSRPARHPARKNRGGERGRGRDAQRLLDHDHAARQGYCAQDGVSGFHPRRRVRHGGDGGRRRLPHDRRSLDLPRAAVGAADGLGAVRHLFRQRQASAVLDPAPLSPRPATAGRGWLRLRRRARSRVPCVQARQSAPDAGRCHLAGRGAARELAVPGLPVFDRDALRSVRAHSRNDPPRGRGARLAAALGRGRARSSQCEFTFQPQVGLSPADTMMLFRSAVKQICRRQGCHATFMTRPKIENVMSSGWHLHQSLRDRRSSANVFMSNDNDALSRAGRSFLAGLLAHAGAATAFTTPTINGYKRYRGYSLAPDRVIWGRDNRGVMIRVLGGPGEAATLLENRVGEPAANPYLYMASQVITGLDGMERMLDPGPRADAPYEVEAPHLPKSLEQALAALREDACLAAGFGKNFIDYYLRIKEAEIARYHSEVTEWEQREYFELF